MSDVEPNPPPLRTLPRVLGAFDAMMVVVGSVIGSGIFLKPGIAARELPSVALILAVWIGVGGITLCGCLSLAELAAMLPQAGGPYVYLREAYGRLTAFLWGWTEFWVVRTGSIGALAVATAIYLGQVVPLSRLGLEVVSVGLVVVLALLNLYSTRWTAHLQNLTGVAKVGFLGLVIVLPYLMGRVDTANLAPLWPAESGASLWRGVLLAMIAVMWPYDGWINIGPVVEEVRDPQRNVPRGLALGMGLVIAVYAAANLSYHLTMPLEKIAGSSAVAAELFSTLIGSEAGKWVALGVMVSTFGAVNSNMLTGPRIYFAMARDGLLPKAIHAVHSRYETPANAVILQASWTVILIVVAFRVADHPGDAFDTLTNYVIFGGYTFYNLAVAAVFVLRRKLPFQPRPYRTWGYPFTPALYVVAFGVVLVNMLLDDSTRNTSLSGLLLIAAGVPVFYWMRARHHASGRS